MRMRTLTQHHLPSGRVSDAAHPRHSSRQGFTLVAVLVTLGLISALLLGAFHSSLKQRRQLERELQMQQTRFLARAAIAHGEAIARSGEDMKSPIVSKPKLEGSLQSETRIEFETANNKVTVTAKAWIGDKDRSEHNTQIKLRRVIDAQTTPQLKNSSRDET